MAINPEAISSSRPTEKTSARDYTKWAIYSVSGIGVFVTINLIRSLLPLLGMGLLIAFIWSQATKPS